MPLSYLALETQETDILEPHKLILPLLFIFVSLNCSKLSEYDTQQIRNALADSLLTTTESWGVSMKILEDGNRSLNLTGSYSATIKDSERHQTKISGPVFIEIFDKDGSFKSSVDCDSAVYRPDEGIFEMFGNVRVLTNDARKLRSEYLKWDRNNDKVSTPEFVIFIAPPDSIAANGFVGDTDLTNYTLNEGGGQVVID